MSKKKVQTQEGERKRTVESGTKTENGEQYVCIRAIKLTPEILMATKQLKKEKGISLYRLGQEAISERLVREGYLKKM